ncbi:MAG: hypothetical protein WC291_10350 [Thermodesulfovibrionales bacterium]|jgi:hypothetical protein
MGTAVMMQKREETTMKATKASGQMKKNSGQMKKKMQALAEAIILQSLEDLWDSSRREESLVFFEGDGFRFCTEMAGIDLGGRIQLLSMAGKINRKMTAKTKEND